ncbi:hypothetical protein BC351_17090 [Paenibacillus ferrarius]|uniref:Uncharacterized protein n=1 Tax=Paenibacillus ferrarius TaxID=1469647 RepID=A0A1V4HRI4_9BACL|nr:hypothetical protein BC351_17090 [Paenibacillus ferrarius]
MMNKKHSIECFLSFSSGNPHINWKSILEIAVGVYYYEFIRLLSKFIFTKKINDFSLDNVYFLRKR